MAFRVACALMFLLFAFSVYVQHNDPDPARWMAIYGAAALASALASWRPLPWYLTAALALLALVWSLLLALSAWGLTSFGEMFGSYKMKDLPAEEGREALGLAIVALWSGALSVRELRRRRVG
jgi:hypothetical protein